MPILKARVENYSEYGKRTLARTFSYRPAMLNFPGMKTTVTMSEFRRFSDSERILVSAEIEVEITNKDTSELIYEELDAGHSFYITLEESQELVDKREIREKIIRKIGKEAMKSITSKIIGRDEQSFLRVIIDSKLKLEDITEGDWEFAASKQQRIALASIAEKLAAYNPIFADSSFRLMLEV